MDEVRRMTQHRRALDDEPRRSLGVVPPLPGPSVVPASGHGHEVRYRPPLLLLLLLLLGIFIATVATWRRRRRRDDRERQRQGQGGGVVIVETMDSDGRADQRDEEGLQEAENDYGAEGYRASRCCCASS